MWTLNFTDEQIATTENWINLYDTQPTFTDVEGVTQIGVYEVAHFFYQIPDGMVTTWDDVRAFFSQKYGSKIELRQSKKMFDSEIPYWKAVSTRGYLEEYGQYYGKEDQRKKLEEIGIEIDEKNRVVDFKNKHFKRPEF